MRRNRGIGCALTMVLHSALRKSRSPEQSCHINAGIVTSPVSLDAKNVKCPVIRQCAILARASGGPPPGPKRRRGQHQVFAPTRWARDAPDLVIKPDTFAQTGQFSFGPIAFLTVQTMKGR